MVIHGCNNVNTFFGDWSTVVIQLHTPTGKIGTCEQDASTEPAHRLMPLVALTRPVSGGTLAHNETSELVVVEFDVRVLHLRHLHLLPLEA